MKITKIIFFVATLSALVLDLYVLHPIPLEAFNFGSIDRVV